MPAFVCRSVVSKSGGRCISMSAKTRRHNEHISGCMEREDQGVDSMTIAKMQKEAHRIAVMHGWIVPPFSDADGVLAKLMLVVSEVAEACEAVRHDDARNFREELADTVIRIMDIAETHGFDLEHEIHKKMVINATRPYKHGGKRA